MKRTSFCLKTHFFELLSRKIFQTFFSSPFLKKRVFELVKKWYDDDDRQTETFLNFLDLVWKGF